ncbi:MAG: MATE family efflux transporter [Alphaproteobacteria bacterium]|nr:MATE family efflux transporter [Alphaproteobacteria bacterium]
MTAETPVAASTLPDPAQRYAHRGNLVDGKLTGHLFRMAAPMTWGIFAIISFQLVDLFFISMLGTDALAAISFTMPVSMAIFSLILGLAIGTSSVLSRKIGQGEHHGVVRITTHALLMGFIAGCILAGLGLLYSDHLFRAMGATPDMMVIIAQYMHIWFAGAVFITLPVIGNAALRATGNAMFPAIVMTIASVVNAIISPLLIFGLLGFPEMGVRGAALGTVFANAGAMIAGLYMLGWRMKMIQLRPFEFNMLGDSWKQLLLIGLPAGITNVIQPVTNGILIGLLAAYGTESVAAFGIVSRVEAFAFVVVMGLAGGMAPIIGQNWGARRYDRVNETLRKAFAFNVIWSLFVAAVLAIWAKPIAGIFSDNAAVTAVAALYFWIVPITYATGNLVPGWASAFNAIGNPERAALMIIFKHVVVLIPAAIIGGHIAGASGIFVAVAGTNLVVGMGLHLYGWRQFKRWAREAA